MLLVVDACVLVSSPMVLYGEIESEKWIESDVFGMSSGCLRNVFGMSSECLRNAFGMSSDAFGMSSKCLRMPSGCFRDAFGIALWYCFREFEKAHSFLRFSHDILNATI